MPCQTRSTRSRRPSRHGCRQRRRATDPAADRRVTLELAERVPPVTRSHVALPELSDRRVRLRAAEPRDLPAIEAGIHDHDVIRWIGPQPPSAHDLLMLDEEWWAKGSPTLS